MIENADHKREAPTTELGTEDWQCVYAIKKFG